ETSAKDRSPPSYWRAGRMYSIAAATASRSGAGGGEDGRIETGAVELIAQNGPRRTWRGRRQARKREEESAWQPGGRERAGRCERNLNRKGPRLDANPHTRVGVRSPVNTGRRGGRIGNGITANRVPLGAQSSLDCD